MTTPSSDAPPLVKQCVQTGHWLFGAVAVAAGPDRWGVMAPNNGGHWATDDEVKDFTDLPLQKAVAKPDPEPVVEPNAALPTLEAPEAAKDTAK